MKENPLVAALKLKKKDEPKEEKSIQFPSVRFLDVMADECLDAKKLKPGQDFHVHVYGKVKSIDDEGRVVMKVTDIHEPTDKEEKAVEEEMSEGEGSEDMKAEKPSSKSVMVQTQESHA